MVESYIQNHLFSCKIENKTTKPVSVTVEYVSEFPDKIPGTQSTQRLLPGRSHTWAKKAQVAYSDISKSTLEVPFHIEKMFISDENKDQLETRVIMDKKRERENYEIVEIDQHLRLIPRGESHVSDEYARQTDLL